MHTTYILLSAKRIIKLSCQIYIRYGKKSSRSEWKLYHSN